MPDMQFVHRLEGISQSGKAKAVPESGVSLHSSGYQWYRPWHKGRMPDLRGVRLSSRAHYALAVFEPGLEFVLRGGRVRLPVLHLDAHWNIGMSS